VTEGIAMDHNWKEEPAGYQKPNCLHEGFTYYECTACKEIRIEQLGFGDHTYGEWRVWEAPTCTKEGQEYRECIYTACRHKEYRPLEATTKHSWNNATCTAPKTCKTCGATEGSAAGHSWKAATCTAPKTCSKCGTTEGSATGHNWSNATCTAPKTCKTCGATEGGSLGHAYAEESKTNGNNVGSVITYRCALCGQTKQKTIEQLSVSAYRSGSASFNGWLSQVSYTTNATGGYGKYQYKYEVYLTESSTSPALTEDFSESNRFGWSSRLYCNGNVLVITVKDEAGNNAKMRIVVDTEDKIG
jgi:hypothetical protein